MRTRRLVALLAGGTAVTALTALTALAPAAPALAQRTAPAVPLITGGPGPPGGPTYSHTVFSDVTINGQQGGAAVDTTYLPAPCWLEPRFTGAQSYMAGDPQPSATRDADSYWWWFLQQEPLFAAFGQVSKQQINKDFRHYQGKPGWWYVPAWVDDGNGWACALGLARSETLNNTFLEFAPPTTAGSDTPGHTIDPQILADLARAALRLPTINIFTSPPTTRSYVNLPDWVWVTYNGAMQPQSTASVPLPGGGALSVTVRTSRPTVSLTVNGQAAGQAIVYSNCGATGSRYSGNPTGTPPCGVTFRAPSSGGPFTLTATARWKVTWTSSTGAGGGFASPPWPLPISTQSSTVTVREIQTINTKNPTSG
jgi:hypothetical protein